MERYSVLTTISDESQDYELEFFGDISPETTIPDLSRILIISKDQSYLTHGIHKFPAKFFPELPRYLIQRYSSKGDYVLDPMCGSGTVVLEAMLNERKPIGIDIDPIARLITKTKTTPLHGEYLGAAAKGLLTLIQDRYNESEKAFTLPEFHYRDNWFRPFVLEELAIIRDCIFKETLRERMSDIQNFFLIIFSSIIRDVSNADPSCTRTVIRKKQQRRISPGETIKKFADALLSQVDSMNQLAESLQFLEYHEVTLAEGSATSMPLLNNSVDLAITSPPYINAVDYPRTHQLEMYWLNLIKDGPLSLMKRNYIGTETVYKKEYSQLQATGYATVDPLLKKIYQQDPRRSFIVFKFVKDMTKQLSETYRVLRPGGRYCIAIGSNLIRGVKVESHKMLSEIATNHRVGFELERSFFSGLIRHFIRIPRKERMLGEWVLILRKPEQ